MDDVLSSIELGVDCSLHIATLSRQTIIESGAEHMGFEGYFLFEASDSPERKGINILCKARSFEAALRLADLWEGARQLS
ncbi:hypothetical protein [Acidocella sp.]|uniref:hypothetical protein n=1 Tax=Acidocella sp. TaxID=50710 RepID=UPI0026066B06|nr:hypothetical protein [Acidocella sp.]